MSGLATSPRCASPWAFKTSLSRLLVHTEVACNIALIASVTAQIANDAIYAPREQRKSFCPFQIRHIFKPRLVAACLVGHACVIKEEAALPQMQLNKL